MAKPDHLMCVKCENSAHSGGGNSQAYELILSFLSSKATSQVHSQGLHKVKVLMEEGAPKPATEESSSPNSFEGRAQEANCGVLETFLSHASLETKIPLIF